MFQPIYNYILDAPLVERETTLLTAAINFLVNPIEFDFWGNGARSSQLAASCPRVCNIISLGLMRRPVASSNLAMNLIERSE